MRHVLIIGGAGYVGSVLVRHLLDRGDAVRVMDANLYDSASALDEVLEAPRFELRRGDIRSPAELDASLSSEVTDVVLLAALVGDPLCKRFPEQATEINVDAATAVLDACAAAGVGRVVVASTCSNYGLRPDGEPATEEDELAPLSLYAETKVELERRVLERATSGLPATVLRIATAFGLSPRMRFDLTISEFTRELALGNELEVYDADTWRPYCHVRDISAAVAGVLDADHGDVAGQVFNVGGDAANLTKRMLVELITEELDGAPAVRWVEGSVDPRDYRVSFAKISEALGFRPRVTVRDGVRELLEAFGAGAYDDFGERAAFYTNLGLTQPPVARPTAGAGL